MMPSLTPVPDHDQSALILRIKKIFLAVQMSVCSYHHGYILDSRGHSIGSHITDSNVYVSNARYITSCSYLSALFQSKYKNIIMTPFNLNRIIPYDNTVY